MPPSLRAPLPDLIHLSFDLMVGLGMALLLLAAWQGWFAWFRHRLLMTRWFLIPAAVAGLAAITAMEAGWIVTEVGRQPWVVYGYLRTSDAVTPSAGVPVTLAVVLVLYAVLTAVVIGVPWLMGRRWRREDPDDEPDRAAPPARPRKWPRQSGAAMTAAGTPSWETITVGVALVATMAAYALFAGADFGGGIWDLLAGSSPRGRRARDAIDASVTPVWEGNQVWIVLGLVLLWTGFPSAFAAITITLFVPLAASVLGIVLRGVGFAFRHEAVRPASKRLTGALFASSSLLAPFFLGAAVGAVTTGRVPPHSHGLSTAAWTTPTALVTGALFVAACAFIGAIYLVGDASRRGHDDLVPYFGHRATLSGLVTGVLAGVNLACCTAAPPTSSGA